MIQTQPLEVVDFTGGITDYFIDGLPNQAESLDNLFINPNRKPFTRWGSQVWIEEQLPIGSFRVSHLAEIGGEVLTFADSDVYFNDSGSFTEITGPAGGDLFANAGANTIITHTKSQGQLLLSNDSFDSIQKIYVDNVSTLQVRNAGLPTFPSGTSITDPPGAGSSYLYAFVLKYEYEVGSSTFLDRGPVFTYSPAVTGGTITSGNGADITLPTSLTAAENWDEANIEIEIYRTIDSGTDFFLVTTVALAAGSYTDETEDADLILNEALYTNGGDFSNETPPKCKFVHAVNDIAYYAHIDPSVTDKGEYRVLQSIRGDLDSVPASFFAETEEEIMGLSSIFDRPIVFGEKFVYRIDGVIGADGTGDMSLVRIDDRAGCAGQNSIVQTHLGIFWAGDVGFYWSDGFKVLKISENINETYRTLVSNTTKRSRITGVYEPSNERIVWAVAEGGNECDKWFVLDLKWGVKPDACFTTASNGTYFAPTALLVYDNEIYRGDSRGYVLKHDDQTFTDPKIDTGTSPTLWSTLTILHDYKSCFVDFGSKFMRKFVPRILVSAANTTNLTLALTSSNDNNRVVGDLQPISFNSNITWGDSLPAWGDNSAQWNYQGIIEEWRRFPAKGLRCQYKQIQITNGFRTILDSELIGQVTVSSAGKTATLGGTFTWIDDIVDYVISFEADGYEEEFLITAATTTTVTFADPDSKAPIDGNYDFRLRGQPKGEVLELNGYVFHWSYLSKTHTPYISGNA